MDCEKAQTRLYEALDPAAPGRQAGLAEHLERCLACKNVQRDLQLIRHSAQVSNEVPLADGFELALRRRLTDMAPAHQDESESTEREPESASDSAGTRRPSRRAVAALVAVAASAVTIWVGAHLISSRDEERSPSYHRLRVAVHAYREVAAARFEVDLPEGVSVAPQAHGLLGRGSLLRWESRLRPGSNSFDIPLRSTREEVKIHTRVTAGGQSSSRTVTIATTKSARGTMRAQPIEIALAVEDRKARVPGKRWRSW